MAEVEQTHAKFFRVRAASVRVNRGKLLNLRYMAVYPEQTYVLAHTLSVETETVDHNLSDEALSLRPGDGLELLESPIPIRQVENALRCDSTAEEEGPFEIGRSRGALLAGQCETRGCALLAGLEAGLGRTEL